MATASRSATYGVGWTVGDIRAAIDRLGDKRLNCAIAVYEWLGGGGEDPEALIADLQRQAAPNAMQVRELRDMFDALLRQLEVRHEAAERAERRRVESESKALGRAVSINFDETSFDPRGCFVYLLWGDDPETPLYVGQSTNVLGRLGTHMGNPDRRHRIRRVQVLRCKNRQDMCKTEDRLIAQYQPPLNVVGILNVAPNLPHAGRLESA